GNITITSTGSILDLINSQITTSVRSGVGGGGNITLGTVGHPIGFVVLSNSGIHADAFGGPGGNVNIFANVLLSSTPILTAITASSALSTSGTISIYAVTTDVTSSLPELKADTREAAALLRASCAARLAEGKTSSLVVAGREGVPLEPGGLMPSALMEPSRVAELGSVGSFLTSEWPGLRLAYLDAVCGRGPTPIGRQAAVVPRAPGVPPPSSSLSFPPSPRRWRVRRSRRPKPPSQACPRFGRRASP